MSRVLVNDKQRTWFEMDAKNVNKKRMMTSVKPPIDVLFDFSITGKNA